MAEEETVKLRVVIAIAADEVVDTGLSVRQWNGMTDRGRLKFVQNAWDSAAVRADRGGVSVATPGASGRF